jgi:hypothetical protein
VKTGALAAQGATNATWTMVELRAAAELLELAVIIGKTVQMFALDLVIYSCSDQHVKFIFY